MRVDFIATFTGRLSTIQGFSLHGANLRVEAGHRYILDVNEVTLQGQMQDFGPVRDLVRGPSEQMPVGAEA